MTGSNGAGTVLPWGWWLRVKGSVIEDVQGREWRSVREAFWEGELGFPATHFVPEQLELLFRVLANIERHWITSAETEQDLFCGDMLFWRFYRCWLWAAGMLAAEPPIVPLSASLSDKGLSVLLMLQAKREPEWIPLPFGSVLDAVRAADQTEADKVRERTLRAFEGGVTRLPHLFARESVHDQHLLTLTGLDTNARMPMRKIVWSLSFPNAGARDDFFSWLVDRVHRWEDWGELAFSKGAAALTQHLLALFLAGLAEAEPRQIGQKA